MKYALPLLLFVTSCKLDGEKTIDRNKFTFKTGSDTQLFFKNIRQSYYDLEENKAAKFNVFRLSARNISDDQPVLNLAIVVNYLQDEAYLLLEPNFDITSFPLEMVSRDSTGVMKVISLEAQNRVSTLHFVSDIYEDLLQGHQFFIRQGAEKRPILMDAKSNEAFRITVADYFRLTRIY